MALRKTGKMLLVIGIILGTGVVGFIFWTSDTYRAATPLVFIFGLVVLFFMPVGGRIKSIARSFSSASARKAWILARAKNAEEKYLWHRHIPQLITNLYFTHIQQYPEWIRESRDYVPSSVTNAGRTKEGDLQLLLYFAQYTFKFTELTISGAQDGVQEQKQGILEIQREGQRILTLRVLQVITKKGLTTWVPLAIEFFMMNQAWINEFENLKTEILAIIKNRAREARES